MSEDSKLAPASDEAIAKGCTCQNIKMHNSHFCAVNEDIKPMHTIKNLVTINQTCNLHGWLALPWEEDRLGGDGND